MSGRNKQAENIAQQNAQTQQDIAKQNQTLATANNDLRNQYQKPFIDFNTKIASGDKNAMVTAAGVPLSNLQQQYNTTKSNIYDTVAPGIGRDVALSQLSRDNGNTTAGYLNQAYNDSQKNLYNAGTESGQMGLQQTGAAYSGFQGSTQGAQGLMNNAAQRKQSTLSAFTGLAGIAGQAATGGGIAKTFGTKIFGGGQPPMPG